MKPKKTEHSKNDPRFNDAQKQLERIEDLLKHFAKKQTQVKEDSGQKWQDSSFLSHSRVHDKHIHSNTD